MENGDREVIPGGSCSWGCLEREARGSWKISPMLVAAASLAAGSLIKCMLQPGIAPGSFNCIQKSAQEQRFLEEFYSD